MDQFYKKFEEDRKAIELENTKLKLRMVSKNSKSSKPSVDDYINNILGSGLKFNKPTHYNKCESQSVKNVHYNESLYSQNHFNQSCNLQSQIQNGNGSHKEDSIQLPSLYQDVIDIVRLSTCELDTSKIYNIFITSGLSQEILGAIWSMINRTSPGQLTQQELVAGLAMIALCQEEIVNHGPLVTIKLPNWDQVVSLTDLPVPRIIINKSTFIKPNNILSDKVILNRSDSTDEWADFSGFVSKEKITEKSTEDNFDKFDLLSSDLSELTNSSPVTNNHAIEVPVLDIRQEINNQFSNWQDDIQTEKTCSLTKSEINTKSSNNDGIVNCGIIPTHVADTNKSTVSVLPSATDTDFGDFQLFSNMRPQSALDECDSRLRTGNLDRYQIFNCEIKGPHDNLIEQWLRCLSQCLKIVSGTVSVLKRVDDEMIKIDVFNSNKGILLLKGIIEVYRVTRNIKLSSSRSNILTSSKPMLDQLSDLEKSWNEFMLVIPDEMQIDVQSRLSRSSQDPIVDEPSSGDPSLNSVCGVCLCRLDHDEGFLSHGLHRYHCPCANLWVNTLDLTLPGLSLPGSVL